MKKITRSIHLGERKFSYLYLIWARQPNEENMAIINYYTTLHFVTVFFSPQLNRKNLETTATYDSRPANVCVGDYQQKV